MDNNTASVLYPEIEKAAAVVARQWPGVIDAEDAQQELWVFLLERPGTVRELMQMNVTPRGNSLVMIGNQIASKYRNDYDVFTGNFRYSTDDVRKLLNSGILTVAREDLGKMNETLTAFLDVSEGMSEVRNRNARYAGVLWDYFVAGTYDASKNTARRVLNRSENLLTDCMNQVHRRRHAMYEDGPGTRTILSNSQAQYQTATSWDGPNA